MQHISPDDLALLALGEGTEEQHRHVAECAECAAELASLSDVVTLARSGGGLDRQPPAGVWDAIAAATGPDAGSAPASEDHPAPYGRSADQSDPGDGIPPGHGASVVSLDSRRSRERGRWSTSMLVAAAVLGAAVTGGVAWLWPDTTPGGVTLADTRLDALTDTVEGASAEVVDRDGRRVLRVSADRLPRVDDGYLEVWLIDEQVSGMITVGLLEATEQEFALPADVDLAAFPVVDVSVEHFDGDPTHSGQSLWRGVLPVEG